ncbi:MAG: hypothetical protein ACRCY3_13100 [Sphingorhabdus sp.]
MIRSFLLPTLLPGSNRGTLLATMKGQVLARGSTTGLYDQAAPPPKQQILIEIP